MMWTGGLLSPSPVDMDDETAAERRRAALREPLVDVAAGTDDVDAIADAAGERPELTYSKGAVCILGLVTLVDAVEYGLIMPSLYTYITEVGRDAYTPTRVQHLFGLALSVFSATSFLSKPLFGALVDRVPYKHVYFVSIILAAGGNVLYACAGHRHAIWMIIAGRALSGVGCANSSLSFSYVSRTVPDRSRTAIMTVLGMSFPLGLVLGPAMNAFTSLADFTLLGLPVTPSNAPGLLIAVVLVILLALILVVMPEPPAYTPHPDRTRAASVLEGCAQLVKEVSHPAIARCVFTIFLFNLYITAVEALVVPVTKHAFGFGTLQNSFVYLFTALEVISLSMAVMYFSKRISDNVLVAVACTTGAIATTLSLLFWTYDMPLWHFIVGEAFMVTCIPFAFAPNRSRFSKLTSGSHNQGLLQSLMSSVASIGSIVGPLYLSALIGTPTETGPIAWRMFLGLSLLTGALLLWELVAMGFNASSARCCTPRRRHARGDGMGPSSLDEGQPQHGQAAN
mmetsp:Transcript_9320/g.27664  ORF Transcript_9320/g.27664 Transcript_9320/m.27664 type:complete len:511 (-) Transcript_9320:239-1771(-)